VITQELVKPGAAFVGADGEVRHVIIVHKPGNGYSVTWDSVPLNGDYWRGRVAREHETRPHGHMTMRAFQKWAAQAALPAQGHDKGGENGQG
jgi:hypothetical protein